MSDEYVPLVEEIDFPPEPNDGDLNISGKGSFGSLNVSGIGTITNLNSTQFFCSGVSTFTNGPVFLGAATSTGTASQPLQVTGSVYVSGNLGIGTTNPTSKLAVDGDVSVSGVITASSFIGDGSGLTGIVGTGSSGSSDFVRTGVGIHTLDNVGIGTTNPTSKLTIGGNALVSGVLTASSFVGNGSGLTGIKIPQNLQTSAYVLSSTDAGKHVAISTGGVTLNSSVFTTGDTVTVYNDSIYTQMINVGVGVTMRRVSIGDVGSRGLNAYGLATILCIANNSYVISGAGLT